MPVISTRRIASKPIAAGRQHVRIAKVDLKTSQNDNDYLMFRLVVTDGDDLGKSLFLNCMVEGAMRFQLEKICEALGIDETDEFDTDYFVGGELDVLVEHQLYQGEVRAQVTRVYTSEEETDPEKQVAFPF